MRRLLEDAPRETRSRRPVLEPPGWCGFEDSTHSAWLDPAFLTAGKVTFWMDDLAMPTFTWQAIKTSTKGPGSRSRHGLVHDREARVTILFGGIVWLGLGHGEMRSDTWELRDGDWTRVRLFRRPRARHRGAMVFDEELGFSVLFGGQDRGNNLLSDTWTYTGRRWRQQRIWWWRRPAPRCGHALAYDKEARQTVLFGGIGYFDRTLGDTWVFDGASWGKVLGPQPPARRYAGFAYDPDLRGCVLHGGAADDHGTVQFGDAWLFREGSWSQLPYEFETDVRDDHSLCYHRTAGTMVMLDGLGGERGVLAASASGWESVECEPLHPRLQCSPLAWDDGLEGLVLHGGERGHGGPQFDATLILRLATVD